jgi:hypothetical protein
MKLGDHWMDLKPDFLKFKEVIIVLLLAGVVWFVWTHWKHRVRATAA